MILNEESVMTVCDDAVVMVLNPETDMYVECRVTIGLISPDSIYLTTTYSDIPAANRQGGHYHYSEHVHHLRGIGSFNAAMSRGEMASLLASGQYSFR